MPLRRRVVVGTVLAVAVSLLSLGSCARYYARPPLMAAAAPAGEPLSVIYLVGDFGRPGRPFRDLAGVMVDDARNLEGRGLRTAPVILALGDNLYEEGLPHELDSPRALAELAKLRAIAEGLTAVRYRGNPVPMVLTHGNHDYSDDALDNDGNRGDISRWYFLDDLGIEEASGWTAVPGDASAFGGAAELYAHLYGDPASHVEFMAPVALPLVDDELYMVALDSPLLIELYDDGHEELAAAYVEALEQRLAAAPEGAWTFIVTHHPLANYGKHGWPGWGNWVFGQGWPQFPNTWTKVLGAMMPLGIAAAVIVHPAALAISAAPPLRMASVVFRKQDVRSLPYSRYIEELLRLADGYGVDGVLSGHDHNTQLIELGEVEEFDGETLQVISGAGSKVDPVRRGPGTMAFLSDYSFVRMTQYVDVLSFEIIDRRGESRYRYDMARR